MTHADLILEAVIALLLGATIVCCWVLSRRVAQFRATKAEFQGCITEFSAAITRAQESLAAIKTLESDAESTLREHLQKARLLSENLSFLTAKGESVAGSLERAGGRPRRTVSQTRPAPELRSAPRPAAVDQSVLSKRVALENVLEQIAVRKQRGALPTPQIRRDTGSPPPLRLASAGRDVIEKTVDSRRLADSLQKA